ncbi:DUF3140 domain-containing protein [Streptomyces sp. YIM 98790]|uniref:DUF3140 domain-containing protein n=1 Tax=Streptomyces sp. YIM 98790 TaxID=2689077 RepID=UPI00140CB2CF|nr:DUF3140 domain-containing protein [Streptomyces sp. YIM 98790]
MPDTASPEVQHLWDEFHQLVNMTSAELRAWLRTSSADEDTEALPEQSGSEQGRRVLSILQKRRVDLTDADVTVMSQVIDTIRTELEAGPSEVVPEREWRHRLMLLGHDPMRP